MLDHTNHDFGEYRAYLKVLALAQIPIELRGPVDPSDIVQQTLCDAVRRNLQNQYTPAELIVRLRIILRDRLVDVFRRRRLESRAKSLDHLLDQTSIGLSEFLWDGRPGPASAAMLGEAKEFLESMLQRLSPAQAEAIILRYFRGMSMAEICRHMDRTPEAVGGLLRDGKKKLRELCNRRIE